MATGTESPMSFEVLKIDTTHNSNNNNHTVEDSENEVFIF